MLIPNVRTKVELNKNSLNKANFFMSERFEAAVLLDLFQFNFEIILIRI